MGVGVIFDDFLEGFDGFRAQCDGFSYGGVVNPVDGVEYPGICELPENMKAAAIEAIERAVRFPITDVVMFLRLSLNDTTPPHGAHTDATMGDYGVILYMNRAEHCAGGTAFVRHIETGLFFSPETEEQVQIWRDDTNLYDAWAPFAGAEMKPNRAFLFCTNQMHRAEKPYAFGDSPANGRLVLVAFFKVKTDG